MTDEGPLETGPARVVHLHVGAPKTGTTLLQDVLFANRDGLREHGVLVPGRHRQSHFHATVDLLNLSWGGVLDTARGTLDELLEEIREWPGDVIVSNENLSLANPKRIGRIRAALPDHELRVVYSARDLVRQIPAGWQEKVKHSYTGDYATFVAHLRDRVDEEARRFWRRQTWPDVVDRWSAGLGGAPATVVTVPATGQDPTLLLGRFCAAFRLEDDWLPHRAARTNAGLGPAETTMLRTIQAELNGRNTPGAVRRTALRGALVDRWWGSRPSDVRVALPVEERPWVSELSQEWVRRLEASGVRVVGDLADLVPGEAATASSVDPDKLGADELLQLAVRTIADAVEEQADLLNQRRLLTRERDELRAVADRVAVERDEALTGLAEHERTSWQSVKERGVRVARRYRVTRFAHRLYRRLRRR